MFKNTYITIIVLIIIYQIFLDCTKDFEIDSENDKDDINKKPKNISVTNKSSNVTLLCVCICTPYITNSF